MTSTRKFRSSTRPSAISQPFSLSRTARRFGPEAFRWKTRDRAGLSALRPGRATALAVLALAALALAVPERAQAQTVHEVAADWALKPDATSASGEQVPPDIRVIKWKKRAATSTNIAGLQLASSRSGRRRERRHTAIRRLQLATSLRWVSTETVNVSDQHPGRRSTDTDVPIYWVRATHCEVSGVTDRVADRLRGLLQRHMGGATRDAGKPSRGDPKFRAFGFNVGWTGSNTNGTTHATGFMGASTVAQTDRCSSLGVFVRPEHQARP